MVTDAEKLWIKRAQDGDAEAISYLYQTHKDKLFKFIYYKVGSLADSEDLFQEIMLAAFDSLPRFRGEVPFLHWCYQIARNKIAYFWRRKGEDRTTELIDETTGFEEDWISGVAPAEQEAEDAQIFDEIEKIREKINAVMDQLPENYRTVLHLRFFESMTMQQIADRMGITLSNAKVLQHRALKKAGQLYALAPSP